MRTGMDKVEKLLVLYGAAIFCTVFVLSLLQVYDLYIYLTGFTIEFFVAILATAPYNSTQSRRQIVIGVVLSVIFAGAVLEHVLIILK
jgi:uncharacterized membrane protein (DUF485 family)